MKTKLNEQALQKLLAESQKVEQELLAQCEQAKRLYLKYEGKISVKND